MYINYHESGIQQIFIAMRYISRRYYVIIHHSDHLPISILSGTICGENSGKFSFTRHVLKYTLATTLNTNSKMPQYKILTEKQSKEAQLHTVVHD